MKKYQNYNPDDLEELLWRAETALSEPELESVSEEYDEYFSEEEEPFPDEEYSEPEDEPLDENFDDEFDLNSAGSQEPVQNFANNYGAVPRRSETYRQERPAPQDVRRRAVVYSEEEEEEEIPVAPRKSPKEPKPKRRRRGCGCGCLTWLIIFVVVIVAAVTLLFRPPRSEESIGTRKMDTATILICGTDEDGTRTDTMMLLYLSGSERQVSLLSLPRDTYTVTASGNAAKLNSAYGRNGCGEEGMDVLMDYVKNIIGYRPDGYILVDFTLVPQIVDIMGGLEFDVSMDMEVAGVALKSGLQHLSGKEVLTLLRYRKGYATADLGRVEVQRDVLKACIDQWLSADRLNNALEAISLLENGSISTLNTSNYVWVAKTLLLGMGNFRNDTLPGVAQYRNDVSYYILNKTEVAELINSSYNPYRVDITADDLKIAG